MVLHWKECNTALHDCRRVALMTVSLFPLRLLFGVFMMMLAWPFTFVATQGWSEHAVEPPSRWRWLVALALRTIMRAMWFSGGFHWIAVKGRLAPPSEAPILTVAPHSSYFDAIPVTMTLASVVMKAESKDIPIWGTLIKFIRPVFVSRSDQDSRRKTVEEIKRRASSAGEWPQIMVFPEGTCTNRSCLISFKPGAFIPGVPVQPVVLRYRNEMDTVSWTWQGPGAFKVLWLTLCQLHNSIEIEYLPTYTPSAEEKRDPTLYASNVRHIMAKALGLPVLDCSFEDCRLALVRGPLALPSHTGLLQFSRLVRLLGLKTGVPNEAFQEIGRRARELCGQRLSLVGLAEFLRLPVTRALRDVFDLFEEHGQMDVREFVVALSVVCRPFQHLETLQLAFRMFEAEEDGCIVEHELTVILQAALGVSDLTVCDVFRAADTGNKGKITFDDFREFLQSFPNFLELFRCLRKPGFSGGPGAQNHSAWPDPLPQDPNTANTKQRRKHD